MFLLSKIRELKEKMDCKNFSDRFYDELLERKIANMQNVMTTISNYLVKEQLAKTGLLYSPFDDYIRTKAQNLFWEWKNEGIINEFENFNEYTWNWIKVYA